MIQIEQIVKQQVGGVKENLMFRKQEIINRQTA